VTARRRVTAQPDVPLPGSLPSEVVHAYLARCRADRAAAGLPEHLEDPTVLDRIASLVMTGRPLKPPARRGRPRKGAPDLMINPRGGNQQGPSS
jgi:hypothetical protein